ncbi:MAG: hypothetical protein VCC99_06875 [Alphaproteobacteria bacterium]|jgi:hypothetical protein
MPIPKITAPETPRAAVGELASRIIAPRIDAERVDLERTRSPYQAAPTETPALVWCAHW